MIVRLKLLTVLIVAGLLAGCGRVDLYTGLTEQQSNEVAAALIAAGISAEKTRASDKKGWAVRVPQASMPHAMSVLKAAGLPSSEYASLGELFERKGFVSSPLEEKARYLHGLSQELAHTLKQLEGVVVARVHIALPEQDVLSDELRPSSASVVLVVHEYSNIIDREIDIKAIVKDSIEGLEDVNKVTVKFFSSPAAVAPEPVAMTGEVAVGRASILPLSRASQATLLVALAVSGWLAAGWLFWGRSSLRRQRGIAPARRRQVATSGTARSRTSTDEQPA